MSLIKFELVTRCKDCAFSVTSQSCTETEPSTGFIGSVGHLRRFPTHTLTYSGGMSGTKLFIDAVRLEESGNVPSRAAEGEER